jgi:Flp pilus assembly protein CpaB
MTYSVRNILIALALAAAAGVLVILYTGNVQKQASKGQQTVTVLVAKTDIAAGTTVKDAITAGAFQTREIVQRDEVPGAYSGLSQLNKSLATTSPIAAQTQITPGMFSASQENPVVTQIQGIDRAMQVALNSNAVLGGTLRAGDHVDVIATCTISPIDSGSKLSAEPVGRVIMTNVPVLSTTGSGAASTSLTGDSQSASATGNLDGLSGQGVILSVPQTDLATLYMTMRTCGIWLVARPSVNPQDSPSVLATACTIFGAGVTNGQLRNYLPVCARGN